MAATTSQPAGSAASAFERLDHFVFQPDKYTAHLVPRDLSPADVAQFVRKRIDRSTPFLPARQVERVVDFYDVQEATETLRAILDRKELGLEELRRSVIYARAIAEAGVPADHAFAADYFVYLIKRADTLTLLQDLVPLYEALGPDADSKPLHERIAARRQALKAKGDSFEVQWEVQKLDDLEQVGLDRAEKANALKAATLKKTNRRGRLDDLAWTYLDIDCKYPEYMQPWSAHQLRREVWGEQPKDQITRTESGPRREDIVQAFRAVIARVDQKASLTDDQKTHGRVRSLHAIEFFRGTLTPEEQKFLEENGAGQVDTLSK